MQCLAFSSVDFSKPSAVPTAWIVGFATLRDTIELKDIGKTFGLVNSFVGAGSLSGPAVAGILLKLIGYWGTWGFVLLVILLDIVMRLVMIENPKKKRTSPTQSARRDRPEQPTAEDALLSGTSTSQRRSSFSALAFYRIILSQPRVIVGLLSYTTYSSLAASYNTTIPMHVRSAFGWGSLSTGLIFAALQAPNILLGPLCGWLRDKMGTRLPTSLGFIVLAPLLWLLGAADQTQFPWGHSKDSNDHAQATYIIAIIAIGCVQNLLTSVGTIEMTCE